jgi:hypothetical protein
MNVSEASTVGNLKLGLLEGVAMQLHGDLFYLSRPLFLYITSIRRCMNAGYAAAAGMLRQQCH